MTARLGLGQPEFVRSCRPATVWDEGPKRRGSMNTHDADGGDGQERRAPTRADGVRRGDL
jgi:hypothetical protein